MKIHVFEKENKPDYVEAIEVQGPLILSDTNVLDHHASTKKFVDDHFSTGLDASDLKGELNVSALRAFGGDVQNNEGSNTFRLKDVNAEVTTRTRTVVNAKGQVIGGGTLEASDIPNVPWSKVINKPTTLDGFGITDAVKLSGGTLDKEFKYTGSSAGDLNPITKAILDSKVNELENIELSPIGSELISTNPVTPEGYLRANGSIVQTAMYPELYEIMGSPYRLDIVGGGKPWKNQYDFNEATAIGSWVQDTNLPINSSYHQCVVTKNRVYIIGGNNTTAVYYAPINEDGSLGAWVKDTNLPIGNSYHQCVVTKNRLYMIGGYSSSYNNQVYYAPINEDGSLGTWVQDTNLPIVNDLHQCVVTKNRLYMIGGRSGSGYHNQVYYAPINEDGSLGTWVQDTNLPIVNSHHQCVVTKNRLYMIGGFNGSYHNQVYYAPINEDGSLGAWVQDTNLPIVNSHHQCVVTKNRLYMIGGSSSSSRYHNQVYYAPINEDGSLGTWVQDTNLSINNGHFQCVVTKNRLYMIGGVRGSSYHNQVYYATLTIPAGKEGGKNDYSEFYNPVITYDEFLLPEAENLKPNTYAYIKAE